MPSQTADGLPYPLPTEPVRDGAQRIKDLADALQLRGHGLRTVVLQLGGAGFDGNGLLYYAWSTAGVTWTARPTVMAIASVFGTGNQSVNLALYQPHNSATTLVLVATNLQGQPFTGNLDIHVTATGPII